MSETNQAVNMSDDRSKNSSELEAIRRRLQELSEENEMYREIVSRGEKPTIVVKHSGNGSQMAIDLGDGRTIFLDSDPSTGKTSASIPYDKYLDLQSRTDWFELGYLYTEDSDFTNPNLILDIPGWVEERTEDEIEEDLDSIESRAALNRLYDYSEGRKDSKALVLRSKVSSRMSELFDCDFGAEE